MTVENDMHRLVLDDGQVVSGPNGLDRHRCQLPAARSCRVRALPEGGDLLLLHVGVCAIVPNRSCRSRRRRQLGGSGGHVPGRTDRRIDASLARRRPVQEHVSLSRPADRAAPQDRGPQKRRSRRRSWRSLDHRASAATTFEARARSTSIARRYSFLSVLSLVQSGCLARSRSIPRVLFSREPMPPNRNDGCLRSGSPVSWKRPARVFSPRATSLAARPNGSHLPSATGPWPSPVHTGCWRIYDRLMNEL